MNNFNNSFNKTTGNPPPAKQDSIFDHPEGTKLTSITDVELDGVLKNVADFINTSQFQTMMNLDPMIEIAIKAKTMQFRARVEKARRIGKKLYVDFLKKFERFDVKSLTDEEIILAYPELDMYLKSLVPENEGKYKVSLDKATATKETSIDSSKDTKSI